MVKVKNVRLKKDAKEYFKAYQVVDLPGLRLDVFTDHNGKVTVTAFVHKTKSITKDTLPDRESTVTHTVLMGENSRMVLFED